MKKQGFTLIELMVVIVIMGILAAVAVPKLFGMIAKSKASEVGPAAGTYIKLQDAYVSESNKVGSWKLIGYVAPGAKSASQSGKTTNFEYVAGNPDVDGAAADISDYSSATKVWGAANWTVSIVGNSNGNSVSYTAAVTGNCEQLTPTFDKIGK